MMDCFSLSIFVYWLLFIRNLRFMLTVTLFYVIRSIHMLVFHLRFPIGYYWNDPHFLSLTVPYGRTSDFFFSGHCGFLAICYFEWRVSIFILIFKTDGLFNMNKEGRKDVLVFGK